MKKMIQLITALALLFSISVIQPAQSQINYGIKGGLNLANLGGEDVEDTDMRTGFHLGGFLELSLLGIVAVEGGAYFSQKGYQSDDGNEVVFKNISTYIDVPVVAKFSPLPLIHFYAGPQASFLLDNTVEFNGES
ncbi:MAG: porin family protein, partial [Bacteroidota bacterium]